MKKEPFGSLPPEILLDIIGDSIAFQFTPHRATLEKLYHGLVYI